MNNYTINRIKQAADIHDVVSAFIHLRKTGVRWTGICPFHEDKHDGNFIVYPKDNCFKCFACDAKGGPVEFVMMYLKCSFLDAVKWLGNRYGILADGGNADIKVPERPKPHPLPMFVLPMEVVAAKEDTRDDIFCNWLRQMPWDSAQRARVEDVLRAYHVGHSRFGHTIWWQIDDHLRVRTGKMMKYKADGHRDRDARYSFDWIHSVMFRDDRFPQMSDDLYDMKQCLFGMHLIDRYGDRATVRLVESEKTAVIMAIAYGNNDMSVWMACGGVENLTAERLAPITSRGRRIVVYPDHDGTDKWKLKASALGYEKMHISTSWWEPADGEKADIADMVVRRMTEQRHKPPDAVGDILRRMPWLREMFDKLDLQPI